MNSLFKHRLAWPVVTLLLLLILHRNNEAAAAAARKTEPFDNAISLPEYEVLESLNARITDLEAALARAHPHGAPQALPIDAAVELKLGQHGGGSHAYLNDDTNVRLPAGLSDGERIRLLEQKVG